MNYHLSSTKYAQGVQMHFGNSK